MARWELNDEDLPRILKRLAEIAVHKAGAFTGFALFDYDTVIMMLARGTSVDKRLPYEWKFRHVGVTANLLGRSNALEDPEAFIRVLSDQERAALQARVERRFTLVTTISIARSSLLHRGLIRRYHESCIVEIRPRLPARYAIKESMDEAQRYFDDPFPRDYTWAVVHVTAASNREAVDRAFDALDLFRGLWAFIFNNGMTIRMSSGRIVSPNEFAIGPVHVLYEEGHRVDSPPVWYEPTHTVPRKPVSLDATRFQKMKQQDQLLRDWISRTPDPALFHEFFTRYGRALDEIDRSNALRKLWAALEQMLGIKNAKYDNMIQRALFPFGGDGRRLEKILLNIIRGERNEIVHADSGGELLETSVRVFCEYLRILVPKLLRHARHFDSMDDFYEFIGLTVDLSRLTKMASFYERARVFRTPSAGSADSE